MANVELSSKTGNDLVLRLRGLGDPKDWASNHAVALCDEAADEIERLTDEEHEARCDLIDTLSWLEIAGLDSPLTAAEREAVVADLKKLRAKYPQQKGKRVAAETSEQRLTDSQCDEVISQLEDYEWTGISRENVRSWHEIILGVQRQMSPPPETPAALCGARDPDHGTWECDMPKGHSGPHEVRNARSAYVSWGPSWSETPDALVSPSQGAWYCNFSPCRQLNSSWAKTCGKCGCNRPTESENEQRGAQE